MTDAEIDRFVDELDLQVGVALTDIRPTLSGLKRSLAAIREIASISLTLTRELISRIRRLENDRV